jgi:hypothetical protein
MKLIKLLNNKYGFAIPEDAPQQISREVSQAVAKLPSRKQVSDAISGFAQMVEQFEEKKRDKDDN